MNNRDTLKGQTVQSTMLLALYGRAKASGLFPDVMQDTEAERIVDVMDYDFSNARHFSETTEKAAGISRPQ